MDSSKVLRPKNFNEITQVTTMYETDFATFIIKFLCEIQMFDFIKLIVVDGILEFILMNEYE